MNWGSSFYSRNSVLSLVQKMTKFCCRRTRWREAHLTILETAALWNDYKASRRQQVEWLHPEWRFLLNAALDWFTFDILPISISRGFSSSGGRDLWQSGHDSARCRLSRVHTNVRRNSRADLTAQAHRFVVDFFVLCQSSVHDRTRGGFVFFFGSEFSYFT